MGSLLTLNGYSQSFERSQVGAARTPSFNPSQGGMSARGQTQNGIDWRVSKTPGEQANYQWTNPTTGNSGGGYWNRESGFMSSNGGSLDRDRTQNVPGAMYTYTGVEGNQANIYHIPGSDRFVAHIPDGGYLIHDISTGMSLYHNPNNGMNAIGYRQMGTTTVSYIQNLNGTISALSFDWATGASSSQNLGKLTGNAIGGPLGAVNGEMYNFTGANNDRSVSWYDPTGPGSIYINGPRQGYNEVDPAKAAALYQYYNNGNNATYGYPAYK